MREFAGGSLKALAVSDVNNFRSCDFKHLVMDAPKPRRVYVKTRSVYQDDIDAVITLKVGEYHIIMHKFHHSFRVCLNNYLSQFPNKDPNVKYHAVRISKRVVHVYKVNVHE